MAQKLVLATHNAKKLEEFRDMMAPLGVEVASAGELGLSEPEETGTTFTENALLKARAAAIESGLPSLADDSGLCVRSLGDAPGIYSARYAINPATNRRDFDYGMEKLWQELTSHSDKSAAFVCVLAYVTPDAQEHIFEGRAEGQIIWPPQGEKGFGYDPIFTPLGKDQTFAEISAAEKQSLSHRGKAFDLFLEWFRPA